MQHQPLTCLCACAFCLTLMACNKTGSKPSNSTTPPPGVGTMNVNLAYGSPGVQAELIISAPGGAVLLDTVTVGSQTYTGTLKTNDTLVDVTTVLAGSSGYFVVCLKSVNASTIKATGPINYIIAYGLKSQPTNVASIVYENIPAGILPNVGAPQFVFTNFPYNEFATYFVSYSSDAMTIYYGLNAQNYAYFLLPSVGLYSLHSQVNVTDSVDCSHLDTANFLTFNRPQPFTVVMGASTFIGILDTTDFTKVIGFTDFLSSAPSMPGVDFEYPKIPVQKYELNVNASDANYEGVGYYSYSDSIPHTLPFLQKSDVIISSTLNNNFNVTFPGIKPTYYKTDWRDSSIEMAIYAPADSSTLNIESLLTHQNSKLLQGFNLNQFKCMEFDMDDINGMSYGPYMKYITNQAAIDADRVTFAKTLQRDFQ